jgi:peptidoglycan hydrolase CwlO-like protein
MDSDQAKSLQAAATELQEQHSLIISLQADVEAASSRLNSLKCSLDNAISSYARLRDEMLASITRKGFNRDTLYVLDKETRTAEAKAAFVSTCANLGTSSY